jgi:hypothetical protein
LLLQILRSQANPTSFLSWLMTSARIGFLAMGRITSRRRTSTSSQRAGFSNGSIPFSVVGLEFAINIACIQVDQLLRPVWGFPYLDQQGGNLTREA